MATKAINLRVSEERLAAIDRAAAMRGQSRTDFLVESGYEAAIASMSERPIIQIDEEAYEDLVAALETAANPNDRLKALLARRAPWD